MEAIELMLPAKERVMETRCPKDTGYHPRSTKGDAPANKMERGVYRYAHGKRARGTPAQARYLSYVVTYS